MLMLLPDAAAALKFECELPNATCRQLRNDVALKLAFVVDF